jgi:hypothetical protein
VADLKSIMTERDFFLKKKISWKQEGGTFVCSDTDKIRYKTGQPMGAYGSFPMLALTNHLLAQMATVMSRKRPSTKHYAIVGDDIVLRGRDVAENYISLLARLGVPINHRKMVVGERTFEFCRRIVREGTIVSVPSWNSYYQAILSGDPLPLIDLLSKYGKVVPTYKTLTKFFERSVLRNMLALHADLHLLGEPRVERIPDDIVTHADRVLSVLDSIKDEKEDFKSDDPYLKRLSYQYKVAKQFRNKIRDLKPWLGVLKTRANSFYLSYVKTYRQMGKIRSSL